MIRLHFRRDTAPYPQGTNAEESGQTGLAGFPHLVCLLDHDPFVQPPFAMFDCVSIMPIQ